MKKYLTWLGIAVLSFFALNRCTVACNRANVIETQRTTIEQNERLQQNDRDSLISIITSLEKDNAVLKADTAMLRQTNSALERNIERLSGRKEVHYHYSGSARISE